MGQPHRIFDSLAYVNELKGAGVSEKQAIVHAETLFSILDEQLLTRQDMHDMELRLSNDIKQLELNIQKLDSKIIGVEAKLSHDIQQLDSKIVGVEAKLSHDIQQLDSKIVGIEAKLSHDIQQLDSKIIGIEAKLSADIKLSEHKIIVRLSSLMVVLFSLLIGVMGIMIKVIH